MFFLTAIGVYAFLKLLAEVDMLLLFLLYYYAGGCVGFCFCVGGEGAPRPLDSLVSDYNGAITPRPFLCVHKEKGKEMHLLMRRRRLCETRTASFKGCSACRHFSKKDCACERRSPWGTLIKNVGVT